MPPLLALGLCAAVTLLAPLAVRPVLERLGVLDVPNARSSHIRPVLRGGGIATLLGMLAGGLAAPDPMPLWLVLGAGALAGLIGLADDLRSLPAVLRFSAQLALGLALGIAVALVLGAPWLFVPLVAVFLAGYINTANFMDGINGISSLHGAVVGAAFIAMGLVGTAEWLVVAGALLAVSHLAFLPWNLLGSRLFPGDCGSYLLGGFVAAGVVVAVASGIPWPAALAPLTIYLTDTVTTFLGRLRRRQRWWEGHREHRYQQLVDSGLGHMAVAAYVAFFTALAAAAGLLAFTALPGALWLSLAAVLAICGLYLALARTIIARRAKVTA